MQPRIWIIAFAFLIAFARGLPAPTTDSSAWPEGSIHRYALEWQTVAAASLGKNARAIDTNVDMQGVVSIRSYGAYDGTTVLTARFESLEHAEVHALGKDLLRGVDLEHDILQRDARIELDSAGHVVDVRFADDSAPIFRQLMRALVLEMGSQLVRDASDDEVDTALGRARFQRAIDPNDPARIVTRRTEYRDLDAFPEGLADDAAQDVSARGKIELDRDGTVRRIESSENIAVEQEGRMPSFTSRTSLVLSLRSVVTGDVGTPPDYRKSQVREPHGDAVDRRASLERRSEGVTSEKVASDVRLVSLLPREGSTEWLWRDSAWLELHPEEADKLLDGAGHDLDLGGRAAAFDLVVISGTPQGQHALVKALSTWALDDDTTYPILVQRLGLLASPTRETIDLVANDYEKWKEKRPITARACAYTLGALARSASDDTLARKLTDTLASDLIRARAEGDRVALIRGLGNAGFSNDASAIVPWATDASAEVRNAVASALRKMDDPGLARVLIGLASDSSPIVAKTALMSLFRRELTSDDWGALKDVFEAGRIPREAHGTLVNEITRREDEHRATPFLVTMLANVETAPDLRQRIESVLRERTAP